MTRTGGNGAGWRAGAAVGVLLVACAPASAFYWHGWPGSRVTPVPTLLTAKPPPDTTTNPPPPPPTNPPPGYPPDGPPGPIVPPPIGPPHQSPEPSTALIGLVGLGTLAARRWWKKK